MDLFNIMSANTFVFFITLALLAVEVNSHLSFRRSELKELVRRARQVEEEEVVTVSAISTAPSQSGAEPCTADQCMHRGTCFGSKAMPFCFCQLGYAGKNCEDRFCDSQRDCNGRGFCMGTTSQFSCLCNLGYSGTRCELQTIATPSVSTSIPYVNTPTTPRRHIEEAEQLNENIEEQI
ncbi:hypothetical protein M3Y96_00504100 [Aphelenchoides besseyi]|nr:hypothetical protein M3Y96_00504100 [Aphelenchoides besseyi]